MHGETLKFKNLRFSH